MKFVIFCFLSFTFTQQTENLKSSIPKELKLMEFMIGQWDFQWYRYDPIQKKHVKASRALSNVYLIQNGNSYCDDFLQKNPDGSTISGSTIRSYDTKNNEWTMLWVQSGDLKNTRFVGSYRDNKFHFTSVGQVSDQYGTYTSHITFYNIENDSYSWREDRDYQGTKIKKAMYYEAVRIEL